VRFSAAVLLLVLMAWPASARAQIKDAEPEKGLKFGTPIAQKLKVGVIIKAENGVCQNLIATVPVPGDWPEQSVKIVDEELSSSVQSVRYRTSAGQLKQMLIEVPMLSPGQVAKALITFEVSHAPQLLPDDPGRFKIPKNLDRRMTAYVGASQFIEVRHPKIIALSKKLVADKETAWEQASAIYDWVQDNIKVKAGDRPVPRKQDSGSHRLGAAALLPGVLSGRRRGQGLLVPVPGRRRADVRPDRRDSPHHSQGGQFQRPRTAPGKVPLRARVRQRRGRQPTQD
jgi:hypothetical protein